MGRWIFLTALFMFRSACAWEDTPQCFRDLETKFFNETIVKESFELFEVYQSTWDPLYAQLKINAAMAPKRISQLAKQQKPNPLEYPFKAEKAKEILIRVQREIFTESVYSFRVWDMRSINGMFDYILEKNEPRLKQCK